MLYYVGPFTKTRQPPNGHPKPDRFRFRCQIAPAGAGLDVKFNPTITFIGRIFDQDSNLTYCYP
jgi:hypothetical protein